MRIKAWPFDLPLHRVTWIGFLFDYPTFFINLWKFNDLLQKLAFFANLNTNVMLVQNVRLTE